MINESKALAILEGLKIDFPSKPPIDPNATIRHVYYRMKDVMVELGDYVEYLEWLDWCDACDTEAAYAEGDAEYG